MPVADGPRDCGSRSMTLSDDETNTLTVLGSEGIGGCGFSVGSGRLRTASAGAGASSLVSCACSRALRDLARRRYQK